MSIKKNDFVELAFTATLTENGEIVDTTEAELHHDGHVHHGRGGPLTVCVGQGQLPKGVENGLVGKALGPHTFALKADDAFGQKNPKLISMIPTNKFGEHHIKPVPGLQINMDGRIGTVKTVSSGRTVVDFNHPLAGKELTYSVKILKLLTDPEEKLRALLLKVFDLKNTTLAKTTTGFVIKTKPAMPADATKILAEKITELTGITSVTFEEEVLNKPVNKN